MAQASKHGGPSITPEEAADPSPPSRPFRVRRPELGTVDRKRYVAEGAVPDEGGEPPSAKVDGGLSTQSSEKESTPSDKPKVSLRQPARTTGNRSRAKEAGFIAPSTGGDGPKTAEQFDEFDEFA